MAKPQTVIWPAPDTSSIATLQDLAAPGNLLLDGYYSEVPKIGPAVLFDVLGRTVSITSVHNLSARSFTIVGSFLGVPLLDVIAGPNNNTIETLFPYDRIDSISVDGAVNDVSVGTGKNGGVKPYSFDYHCNNSNFSVQVEVAGLVTYTFYVALNRATFLLPQSQFHPIADMVAQVFNKFGSTNFPFDICGVNITDSTGAAIVTYLQQGLHS